jgi:hypothetical protein
MVKEYARHFSVTVSYSTKFRRDVMRAANGDPHHSRNRAWIPDVALQHPVLLFCNIENSSVKFWNSGKNRRESATRCTVLQPQDM